MSLLSALTRRALPRPEARREPVLDAPAPARPIRVVVPAQPQPIIALPPPRDKRPRHDLRNVSPRRFAEIAHELYLEGSLKWPEYQLVGFPSELHPAYDRTIGALTGEKARPNLPRDLLQEWEQRVDFMRRHGDPAIMVAERALDVLRRQCEPHV